MKALLSLAAVAGTLFAAPAFAGLRLEARLEQFAVTLSGSGLSGSLSDYLVSGDPSSAWVSVFNSAVDQQVENLVIHGTSPFGGAAATIQRDVGGEAAASVQAGSAVGTISKMSATFSVPADRSLVFHQVTSALGSAQPSTGRDGILVYVPVGATITMTGLGYVSAAGNHPDSLSFGYTGGSAHAFLSLEGAQNGEVLNDEVGLNFYDEGATPFNETQVKTLQVSYTNHTFAPALMSANAWVSVGGKAYLLPAVPEPSTYALMLAGLALTAAVVRRRSR